jgi:hypothetical protein
MHDHMSLLFLVLILIPSFDKQFGSNHDSDGLRRKVLTVVCNDGDGIVRHDVRGFDHAELDADLV